MARFLSIEIDNCNIKIIEASKKGETLNILRCMSADIVDGLKNGKITDVNLIVNKISDVLKINNIKTKKVAFVINSSGIMIRTIRLPLLKKNTEITSMIEIELQHLMSTDLSNYKIMYEVSSVINENDIQYADYIVYCVPKILIHQYVDMAKKLNLKLIKICIPPACINSLYKNGIVINDNFLNIKQSCAFIKTGEDFISFCVVSNGFCNFYKCTEAKKSNIENEAEPISRYGHSKSENYDGNSSVDDSTMDGTNIDDASFDNYSNLGNSTVDSPNVGCAAVDCTNEDCAAVDCTNVGCAAVDCTNVDNSNIDNSLVAQITKFMRYYYSVSGNRVIDKIYIYGDCSLEMIKAIKNSLSIDTEIISCISGLTIDVNISNIFELSKYFNTVSALFSYKGEPCLYTNLKLKLKNKYGYAAILLVLSIIAAASIALVGFFNSRADMQNELKAMISYIDDGSNNEIYSIIEGIKDETDYFELYLRKAEMLKKEMEQNDYVDTNILREINRAKPFKSKLTSIYSDKDSTQLECVSPSMSEAALFFSDLKKIDLVENVYIPAIQSRQGQPFSYSIVLKLKDVNKIEE